MADWLPKSYLLSQITILALGLWAIVHRDSAVEIELVCNSFLLSAVMIFDFLFS